MVVERVLGDLLGLLDAACPVGALRRSWNCPASTAGRSPGRAAGRRRRSTSRGRGQVGRHDQPAQADEPRRGPAVARRGARSKSGRRGGRSPRGGAVRSSQTERTGTNVLESRYEAIIAKPTASDSGTNSAWAAPCMKNDGMNTARMQSIASSRGTAVSMLPCRTAQRDRVGPRPSARGCSRSRRSPRRPGCRPPGPGRRASSG